MQRTSVLFTIVRCYYLWLQVLKCLIKGCINEWTDKHMVQIYKILHNFLSRKNLGDQIWVRHVEVNRNRKKQSGMFPAQSLYLGCLNCLANSVQESLHAWLLFCLKILLSSMPSPQRYCLCPHLQLISILVTILNAGFDRSSITRHTFITHLCEFHSCTWFATHIWNTS